MTNPLPPTDNWEIKFESKFPPYMNWTSRTSDVVKDFIRSLLADQTKRARLDLVRELEEDTKFLLPITGENTHNVHLLRLLNKLEALKSSLEEK